MNIMEIDKGLIDGLLDQARENARLRQNYDLRTSTNDNSQRMLNALLPGTEVPVHTALSFKNALNFQYP